MERKQSRQQLKIDCHTHILPGMDDGARDADISLQMLRKTYAYGVETVLLTPHFYPTTESLKSFFQRRENTLQVLRAATDEEEIPRLLLGAEVRLERELSQVPGLEQLCIEGTDRLLLEMPYLPMDNWMIEELENICYTRRLKLIFAHLPRYLAYYNDDEMEELLSLPDVIVQVNAEDMLFRPARKHVLQWIDAGVPIIFGSDCHDMDMRCPSLDQAAKYIAKPHHGFSPAQGANDIAAELGWIE